MDAFSPLTKPLVYEGRFSGHFPSTWQCPGPRLRLQRTRGLSWGGEGGVLPLVLHFLTPRSPGVKAPRGGTRPGPWDTAPAAQGPAQLTPSRPPQGPAAPATARAAGARGGGAGEAAQDSLAGRACVPAEPAPVPAAARAPGGLPGLPGRAAPGLPGRDAPGRLEPAPAARQSAEQV